MVAGYSGRCSSVVSAERCSSPEVAAGCRQGCSTRCFAVVVAVADCQRFVKELESTNPPRRFSEIVEVAGRRVAASGHSAAGRAAAEASNCSGELAGTAENSAEEVSTAAAAAAAAAANRDYFCRTHDR